MVPINYLQENLVDKNNENYLKTIKIDLPIKNKAKFTN